MIILQGCIKKTNDTIMPFAKMSKKEIKKKREGGGKIKLTHLNNVENH